MSEKYLKEGKLPSSLLKSLLDTLTPYRNEVIIPPNIGNDAAGLKIGEKLIAVSTDPITFASENIGTYAVEININDIACLGAKPRWFTSNILLPPSTTEEKVRTIWQQVDQTLSLYGVQSIGGHIEVTSSVNLPVIVGQIIGEAISESLLDIKDAQPGDKILLYQAIGIEGTTLLAQECWTQLTTHIEVTILQQMKELLYSPGICIWPFVQQLLPNEAIIALHDPTEGGISTALHEVADATNCGLQIEYTRIPILDETKQLAKLLNFNPLGLLSSGCLILICKAGYEELLHAQHHSQTLYEIGTLTDQKERILINDTKKTTLPRFDSDEIIQAFRSADKLTRR